jgi:hypothetical protein
VVGPERAFSGIAAGKADTIVLFLSLKPVPYGTAITLLWMAPAKGVHLGCSIATDRYVSRSA